MASLKRKRFAKALRARFGVWAPSPGKGGYGGLVQSWAACGCGMCALLEVRRG